MAKGRIQGITIEIGGDSTKLQDALKGVNKSLSDTQGKLNDVNKLLKLDPKNTELLAQKNELLTKAIEDTNAKLKLEKEALEQLKAGEQTEKTIQQQKDLEREIVAVEAKLKDYKKELDATGFSLKDFGNKAQQVADKTKALSASAAALGGALLGNAYSAARSADDLNTLSKQTGISTDELQKMQYASDLIDVSMEAMTGSLAKLTKQMGTGSKTFEKLGVSITNENGEMRDAVDVWYESLEALSKIENETERDQLAMDLFGKSANELAGIVDDGGQALKDMGEEAESLGLVLSQDSLDAANEFNDSIDRMKARTSAAMTQMGASLAKVLVPAIEKLLNWVTKAVQWFANLDGQTQKVIVVIAGLVAAISPVAAIISKITTVVGGLSAAMTFLTSPIGLVVTAIAAAIAIGVLLYKNWDTIKAKASELGENIKQTFDSIKQNISDKINSAKDAVHSAIEKIKSFFRFEWSLPPIKLPHFNITGGFSWSLKDGLKLPKISVDWYKKAYENAVMFNSPTVIPTASGLKGFGDGNGAEIVMGINKLRELVGTGGDTINININGANKDGRQLASEIEAELTARMLRRKAVF